MFFSLSRHSKEQPAEKGSNNMQTFYPLADLPLGLGHTGRENARLMEYFSALSPDEQRQVMDGSRTLSSEKERRDFLTQVSRSFPPGF